MVVLWLISLLLGNIVNNSKEVSGIFKEFYVNSTDKQVLRMSSKMIRVLKVHYNSELLKNHSSVVHITSCLSLTGLILHPCLKMMFAIFSRNPTSRKQLDVAIFAKVLQVVANVKCNALCIVNIHVCLRTEVLARFRKVIANEKRNYIPYPGIREDYCPTAYTSFR